MWLPLLYTEKGRHSLSLTQHCLSELHVQVDWETEEGGGDGGGRKRETKRGREGGEKHRTHSHTHKRLHTRDLDGEMFTCFRHIVLIVYNFFEF